MPPTTAPPLSNEEITADLERLLGSHKVLSKLIEKTAKAGDASIYRLVPRVVVLPETTGDIQAILAYCHQHDLYLTFRAAGTSLSGQAVTDGILVDISRAWRGLKILDEGKKVVVEPGVIAAHVNAFLAPYRRKIGPDPASINACMMGGVAANNASGMCCGVEFNSYHTMHSLRMVLADGYELDSGAPDADRKLQQDRPELYQGLLSIREAINADSELRERVRRKFRIKNTCGYSMNAFIDFERPVEILAHLLIGSEGTLGYIAEITLNTLPDKPMKATSLVYFEDLVDAGRSIAPLEQAGAAVLEIMDRASMASVADEMNYPFRISNVSGADLAQMQEAKIGAEAQIREGSSVLEAQAGHPSDFASEHDKPVVTGNCAALLIEFQENTEDEIRSRLEAASAVLGNFRLLAPVTFTRDPVVQAEYWHMRKGLFPSVGAMREIGTAVIIEDVCVEPRFLADAITDIQQLFVKYDFPEAIIFGHARNGNVHFVISTDFADARQVSQYAGLMDELTRVIVEKYVGSLKAEHGTGRNIAPFVELEWGEKLYQLMWDVKQLLDPAGVLSPGVILNRDPKAHLKDLKVMPAVSPVVDKCIECGFCEPRCPSRDITITPRQRIAVLREVTRLQSLGDAASIATVRALLDEYEYYGNATCATDGMCATSCPVKINTGEMIKELRHEEHPKRARRVAVLAARNFRMLAGGARLGLGSIRLGGPVTMAMARLGASIGFHLTGGAVPRLPRQIPLPRPAPALPIGTTTNGAATNGNVVYYATCLTRSMGSLEGEKTQTGLAEAVVRVLEKCGYGVIIPEGIASTCCGQPFFSKGYTEAGVVAATRTVDLLWSTSQQGKLPILCDTSPCSGQFHQCDKYLSGEALARWKKLQIIDLPTFLARTVVPQRSDWPKLSRRVVLHPTCTLIKLGGLPDLTKVARTFASDVEVPVLAECCGFAGDRGYLFPELTLSATRPESAEVVRKLHSTSNGQAIPYEQPMQRDEIVPEGTAAEACCYSTCRTCEIGMTAGTGQVYSNIVHLVYDALFPKS